MGSIIERKFIFPPVVLAIFITVVAPSQVVEKLKSFSSLLGPETLLSGIAILLGSIIFVLATGFILTSVAYFITNILGRLGVRPFNVSAQKEFKIWTLQSEKLKSHAIARIKRRWDLAITNLSATIISLFSLLILPFVFSAPFNFGYIIIIVFMMIFFINTVKSFKDISTFDDELMKLE